MTKTNREKLVDQILHTENKIEQHEPHYKPEMNSGAPKGWAVPALLVASVLSLLLEKW